MKIHFMAFFVFERRVNAMDEKKDVEFTQQAVPLSQRKGFLEICVVWIGYVFVVTGM